MTKREKLNKELAEQELRLQEYKNTITADDNWNIDWCWIIAPKNEE